MCWPFLLYVCENEENGRKVDNLNMILEVALICLL